MDTERLLKLAAFLDTLPPEKFDFRTIGYQAGKPMQEALAAGSTRCGTVGCAIGWMPACFPEGLKWVPSHTAVVTVALADNPDVDDFDAAARWFDISMDTADFLFVPTGMGGAVDSGLPKNATPSQVAKHIRGFVSDPAKARSAIEHMIAVGEEF